MAVTEADVRLLQFRARVVATAEILDALTPVFPPERPCASLSGDLRALVEVRDPDGVTDRYRVLRDGEVRWETTDPDAIVPALDWVVTTAALEYLGQLHLLFHAGAVARDGIGILLPAASGSGKTTLVAGLLAVGFQYLSDDVAVYDLSERVLRPFHRSPRVKSGSFPVLAPLFPDVPFGARSYHFQGDRIAYVAVPRDSWCDTAVQVRYVIFPRYIAGTSPALQPIGYAAALQHLLEQSFNAHTQGAKTVTTIVDLLRDVPCYALTMGDLRQTARLVEDLVTS